MFDQPDPMIKIALKTLLRTMHHRLDDIVSPRRSARFCRLCGARPKEFAWGGFYLEVLRRCKVTGAGWRAECACPACRSSDRERLVYEFLRRETPVFKRRISLLHVAPELNLSRLLRTNQQISPYVTADLQMDGVSIRSDLTSLPFPDGSFEALICNHVLEHIHDEQKALKEVYRVLLPGGWAILQVPISLNNADTIEEEPGKALSPEEREKRFGQDDHVRLYGQDYKSRLERAGFKVSIWSFSRENGIELSIHLGIKAEEDLYYVQKA